MYACNHHHNVRADASHSIYTYTYYRRIVYQSLRSHISLTSDSIARPSAVCLRFRVGRCLSPFACATHVLRHALPCRIPPILLSDLTACCAPPLLPLPSPPYIMRHRRHFGWIHASITACVYVRVDIHLLTDTSTLRTLVVRLSLSIFSCCTSASIRGGLVGCVAWATLSA